MEKLENKQDNTQVNLPTAETAGAGATTDVKADTKTGAKADAKADAKTTAVSKEAKAAAGGAKTAKTTAKKLKAVASKDKAASKKTAKKVVANNAKADQDNKYAVASLKMVKGSPLKVRSVTNMLKGEPAKKAVVTLKFCTKKVATDIRALLKSAMANAENNHDMDIDALIIDHIEVGKAMVLKRMRPRAKGRGVRVQKHFSNIKVYLIEQN